MSTYFGTDGIRLQAAEFTYDFLRAVVSGLVEYHSGPFNLLIGGDTRESTSRILGDLAAIAAEQGITCTSVSVFPTPAINFYTESAGFDFAIDVTASHNPANYNGLKIFELKNGQSVKLGAPGRDIIEAHLANIPASAPANLSNVAPADHHEAAISAYLGHLRDYLGACDFRGLKIGLDCANGATSVISNRLFHEFGAETTVINADQNFGTHINQDCGSTHLEGLKNLVLEQKLDFGVAFDGDGDRCLLVDNEGNIVDGDKILAILAEYLELESFVGTVMIGQGVLNWAAEKGITVEITDVGDQNVFARMIEKNIKLGGEQSGHIILPLEPMGDGMLTALMITKIISERHQPLSAIAGAIPTLPQVMVNIPATKAQKANLESSTANEIIQKFNDFLSSRGGRLLVRPSGTEDLIRITIWGDENTNIAALAEDLARQLQEVL